MYTNFFTSATLFSGLLDLDTRLAKDFQESRCRFCGGKLHSARYPRKARGLGQDKALARISFCCDQDSCRRRHTPPSVIFLKGKVYTAASTVLAILLVEGTETSRIRRVASLIGCNPHTVRRWLAYWAKVLNGFRSAAAIRERVKLAISGQVTMVELWNAFAVSVGIQCDGAAISVLRFLALRVLTTN